MSWSCSITQRSQIWLAAIRTSTFAPSPQREWAFVVPSVALEWVMQGTSSFLYRLISAAGTSHPLINYLKMVWLGSRVPFNFLAVVSFWIFVFLVFCLSWYFWVIVTGSIARSANLTVFSLLRGQFWGFSPRRGDTLHRWGWNLAWRRGPKVPSSMPNFTPIGATTRV